MLLGLKNNFVDIIESIIIQKTKYCVPRLGRVKKVNDPNNKGRILVAIPAFNWLTEKEACWCFPIDKKSLITPAVDDWVIVQWVDGHADLPVYIGIANEMKDMLPKAFDGNPKTQVLYQDSEQKINIVFDAVNNILNIGKGGYKNCARKDDQIKSVTADDSTFWTTFIGGLITWLSTHVHSGGTIGGMTGTSANPTPSNPGSIIGKITSGSEQVNVGDK
jgi:hypothetical protein